METQADPTELDAARSEVTLEISKYFSHIDGADPSNPLDYIFLQRLIAEIDQDIQEHEELIKAEYRQAKNSTLNIDQIQELFKLSAKQTLMRLGILAVTILGSTSLNPASYGGQEPIALFFIKLFIVIGSAQVTFDTFYSSKIMKQLRESKTVRQRINQILAEKLIAIEWLDGLREARIYAKRKLALPTRGGPRIAPAFSHSTENTPSFS